MSLRASTSARAIVRTTSRAARLGPVGSTSSLHCTCRCSISTAAVPPPPRPRSTPGSRFHSTVASTRSFATEAESAAFSPQSHIEEHDIVIVGGGPVGLALANALAASKPIQSAKCKMSLLEAGDLDKIANWNLPTGKFSNRISSITEDSQAFLKASGGWNHLDHSRTRACEEMQVWDGLTDSRIEFSSWDVHPTATEQPEMAKFVENVHLQKSLLLNLRELNNVECIDKTRVKDIVQSDVKSGAWPIVHLENERRIRARLLVGADGFNSPVKTYSGIKTVGWAYDVHCLVGTLELETSFLDKNTTAWQRFLPVGPVGFLPISDNHGSLAWSTKPEIAAALKKLDSETLSALINASFRLPWSSLKYLYHQLQHSPANLLQEIAWRSSSANVPADKLPREHTEVPPVVKAVHLDTCASFPLKFSHAESYLGVSDAATMGLPKRTALIGDAAHTIHPMAGQGLNLGLGDAKALAETIEAAVIEGADVGSKLALDPYPRKRYLENHTIMNFIDKLHKLYSTEFGPVVWARSTGVEILNEFPSIKGAMMGTAGAARETGPFSAAAGPRSAGLWGTVASAVETAGTAREIGGALLGGLRSRLASAIAPK